MHNKPFALVTERHGQAILFATNAIAEQEGLNPGMKLADARAIFPKLSVEPTQIQKDKAMLEKIRIWCSRYSPWTSSSEIQDEQEKEKKDPNLMLEGPGGGGIWIDATGCSHLFGGEEIMLTDLVNKINQIGFISKAAIAETRGAAWALARYGQNNQKNWTIAPLGTARETLAPLPTAALRLSSTTRLNLQKVGLHTIGDLLKLPRATLSARYGTALLKRLDAAIGKVSESISAVKYKEPLYVRISFSEPIGNSEDFRAALEKMLILLCQKMESQGVGARRLIFTLYRVDGSIERRLASATHPIRDVTTLKHLFNDRINDIDPGFGVEETTLFAERTEALGGTQAKLSDDGKSNNFTLLIDRLTNRFGNEKILSPRITESHIPERAGTLSSITEKHRNTDIKYKNIIRPVRLLYPPEEVETIGLVSKLLVEPPSVFRWRKVLHKITLSQGPERISPEWWRLGKTGTRDYFQVEDSRGQRLWIFRETNQGSKTTRWYVHGLFS